jgi:hypothetical protein
MNIESVKSLFTLFSGEEDHGRYAPVISLAMAEVERMLLPDADRTDIRLEFLCAAAANHRLQQLNAARDRTEVTYAGDMLQPPSQTRPSGSLAYSERLLRDYMQLCEDLIQPRNFVFISF